MVIHQFHPSSRNSRTRISGTYLLILPTAARSRLCAVAHPRDCCGRDDGWERCRSGRNGTGRCLRRRLAVRRGWSVVGFFEARRAVSPPHMPEACLRHDGERSGVGVARRGDGFCFVSTRPRASRTHRCILPRLHPTPNPSPSSCRRRVFDTTGGESWRHSRRELSATLAGPRNRCPLLGSASARALAA
jgi:hypothetical protein